MDRESIKGRYPGGPRREPTDSDPAREPVRPLRSVGDMDERAKAEFLRNRRGRRSRRILFGALFVFVAAAAVGLWMGFRSSATADELADELNRANQPAPGTEEDRMLREILRLQQQQQRLPPSPQAAPTPGAPRP